MINDLQWHKMKWNNEMTDSNSLAQALLTRPEISNTLAYAFGDKFHLQYLTQGSGRVSEKYKLIGNSEFKWPLQGMLHKAIPITGAISPATTPGLNRAPFTIPLSEKYFSEGDVVRFEDGTLARIQGDGVQNGSDFIYTMILLTSSDGDSVPAAVSVLGKELSFEWTLFEEHSKGGSSKEAYPMWFRNQLSTSRLSWAMSGSSRTDVIVLEGKNSKGKKSGLWIYEKQYQQMLDWMKQTERMRWYGVYNRDSQGEVKLPGGNGRPVLSGAGCLGQLANVNRRNYTQGSEQLYRDFISDLVMNSKEAENKKFVAFGGRGALDEFNTAMRQSIQAARIIDTHIVSRNGMNLKFGSDFVTYQGLLNTEITLVYNPIFDDPVHNREIHPKTGLPKESYRLVILDFSDYAGEPNISLCAKGADGIDRSMVNWYTAGSTTPEGGNSGVSGMLRSNSLDGFESHMLSETAIKITNPLACGELVFL